MLYLFGILLWSGCGAITWWLLIGKKGWEGEGLTIEDLWMLIVFLVFGLVTSILAGAAYLMDNCDKVVLKNPDRE